MLFIDLDQKNKYGIWAIKSYFMGLLGPKKIAQLLKGGVLVSNKLSFHVLFCMSILILNKKFKVFCIKFDAYIYLLVRTQIVSSPQASKITKTALSSRHQCLILEVCLSVSLLWAVTNCVAIVVFPVVGVMHLRTMSSLWRHWVEEESCS